jgi:hypothetical protein
MLSVWQAASYQGGGGSAAGRIALVAVAVLAVGAYAVLQIKTRSRDRRRPARRRRYDPLDWRTYPRQHWPAGRGDEAPSGNQERCRPDWKYGYPPGYEPYPLYDPARSPWTRAEDATSDRGTDQYRPGARRPS